MVSELLKAGYWVFVRKKDGLLWPAIIRQIDPTAHSARVAYIKFKTDSESLSPEADVSLQYIYDFPWNAHRLLQEAKQATFSDTPRVEGKAYRRDTKSYYIALLEMTIDKYSETKSTRRASSSLHEGNIAILPVLRTPSPPPGEPTTGERQNLYEFQRPEEYGIPFHDAVSRGFQQLYFVDDYDSAWKRMLILNRKDTNLLKNEIAGIVCERHPQWVFTSRLDCKKHFQFIHPEPPPRDSNCSDVDMEPEEEYVEGAFEMEDDGERHRRVVLVDAPLDEDDIGYHSAREG
ncbi:hypothetical protein V9T40_003519 [Parthenolecanium corni]|uniref:PWWP domain-containing protein n=1 Tax=Parthenolecanium corni TaxID=536013 RepID=A0AAN9TVG5_9HEMI